MKTVCKALYVAALVTVAGCSTEAPPASVDVAELPGVSVEQGSEPDEASRVAERAGQPSEAAPSATAASGKSALPVLTTEQIFVLPNDDGSGRKLSLERLRTFLDDPKNHEPFVPAAPLGLHADDLSRYIPADNPLTRAKVELGRQLYFDKRLSRDGTVACATCHDPAKGWAEHTPVSTGIGGQKGGRNAPTIINRLLGASQFWDGRAASLEEQALGPIENPIEMGFDLKELVKRLKGIEGYRIQFDKIFGQVSADGVAKAIASFERTVLVGNSPFDYYEQAKPYLALSEQDLADPEIGGPKARAAIEAYRKHPMSESALRGRALFFGKAECSTCHVGPNLTDEQFYNIGVGMEAAEPDPGRAKITGKKEETGAFKVPTCRNVAQTAPYMHDGQEKTLEAVIEHYVQGGFPNPYQSNRIRKLNLTEQEKKDLLAFLTQALTGQLPDIKAPQLP